MRSDRVLTLQCMLVSVLSLEGRVSAAGMADDIVQVDGVETFRRQHVQLDHSILVFRGQPAQASESVLRLLREAPGISGAIHALTESPAPHLVNEGLSGGQLLITFVDAQDACRAKQLLAKADLQATAVTPNHSAAQHQLSGALLCHC